MIFSYCERGLATSLWGEPLNAISSLAFVIAAGVAMWPMRRTFFDLSDKSLLGLMVLGVFVGVGSTGFHLWPTPVTRAGDVAPIALFVGWYLAWSVRAILGVGRGGALATVMVLAMASGLAASLKCPTVVAGPPAVSVACLNGSFAYVPVLAALIAMAVASHLRRHVTSRYLMGAGIAFAAAIVCRSLDFELCAATRLVSRPIGLHWLWHILAATAMYLLLRGAVRHATSVPESAASRLGGRDNHD